MAVEFSASTSSFLGGAPGTAVQKNREGIQDRKTDGDKERKEERVKKMLRLNFITLPCFMK